MRFLLKFFLFFSILNSFSQDDKTKAPAIAADSLYREDQFYLNFTYNNLQKLKELNQNKFSSGFCIGFLRDMPINKSRTFAFAAGLGYSLNIYNSNLYIYKTPNSTGGTDNNYEILSPDIYYNKNKLSLHYLDLPIEFRWRSSTPESHKFWRVYTGVKLSYLLGDRYKFVNDIQSNSYKGNKDLNKIQYGCYIAAGLNTWNFYAYYGLNPIFKSAKINNEEVKMVTFNVGLQFYIL